MKLFQRPIVVFLGIILAGTTFGQADLKRANKQYELGDFGEAAKSYQEILQKQPDHLEANSKVADSYRLLNQLEKALPHYEKAVAQQGVDNMTVFQYGLTLQGLGRYELAREVFERLAANSPDFQTRARQFAEAANYAAHFDEPALFKVANEFANSPTSDFGVALLKGERVVYASFRQDIKTRDSRSAPSGDASSNRLLITQRDKNGFLETPVSLHSGFKNETNEGPVAYSPDGQWAAITKNNFKNGTRLIPSTGMELTLYIAQTDDKGDWSNAIPFPHNGIGFSTGYPAFSQDGNALYFASDRPGGYGGFDIWVSYRTGSTWSVPENLGTAVNSLGNEVSPFHDGSSLYFASDFHKGFGGFDIFRAEESLGRWATIYHGGSGLNSSSDDFGFVFDPLRNIGYFVSNRPGGKGYEDIYRIMKETDNVVIKVTDAITGKPISDAAIDFSACGDKSYQTNVNGVFNFQIMEDLNCAATVSKAGYFSKPVNITSLGLRQNRTLEISLTSENSAYRGKTLNGSTGTQLEEVKVIATNQKNGEITETTADQKGDYLIALQENTPYLLRFSKAGFRDVSFNFTPGGGEGKTVPNIEMLPVGVAGEIKTPATTPATSQPASVATTNATPKEYSAPEEMNGYAVQLAAVTSPNVDLGQYQAKMGTAGKVYSVMEGGRTKIRVGIFTTRTEAEQAQKIARASGYTGAFIVEEKSNTTGMTPKGSTQPQPAAVAAKTVETYSTPSVAVNPEGFSVRLATYKDLKNFNPGKVEDLGVIHKVEKGDYTIVLLSGFDSKSSAEIALRKAKGRGFPDAYLVIGDNGDLKRVQ